MNKLILTIILLLYTLVLVAQPIPGGRPEDGGAGTHEDTQMSVTTATILLLGLGIGYIVVKQHLEDKK